MRERAVERPSRRRRDHDGVRWAAQAGQAATGVLARPGRLVLTTLGIALGLASLVATLGLATTAAAQVSSRFDAVAATQVAVAPADSGDEDGPPPVPLPDDAAERVTALVGVVAAGTITRLPDAPLRTVPLVDPSAIADPTLPILAASPGIFATVQAGVVEGRFFDRGHDERADLVVVVGVNAAARLGIERIDQGPAVFIDGRPFTVIGIADAMVRHSEMLDGVVMPEGTARRLDALGGPQDLQIRTAPNAAALVAHQAPIALSPNDPGAMTASAPPTTSSLRDGVTADVDALFVGLGVVALLAGAVGIANVMLVSVLERTSEIGLRRALGATRRNIASQFMVENAIVGLLGGVVGASGGLAVSLGVAASKHWTPVFDVRLALGAPLLGAVVGVLAGAFPAMRAARTAPITALRSA
jgi:putative ABC transport system permease protein